jgi:cytochrome oxidase Cu insertion factor (SCO1/SenC/PrrC family)
VRAVPADEDHAAGPAGVRPPRSPAALIVAVVLSLIAAAAVVGVIVSVSGGRTATPVANQAQGTAADRNPDVDPGTSLPGSAAPAFTLTDQYGSRISLRQFRGQAVVIAFVDARCTTVCPLTTVSLTEAVSMLGPAAGRHVQLLGIDANPDATRVADVRAYSVAHQMMRSWDFLTGSRRQLAAVWRAYHVYVAASHGNIDHEPAVYLIDPQGRERTLYLTQMAYASITQQAQLIAGGLSRLLPGHPALHGSVPMTLDRGIRPATPASLPVIGGDRQASQVRLGPAHPHVVVFLASWDSEVSDLTAELRMLAGYQRQALRHGWPSVVAVDESRTETSPAALTRLLAQAGGAKLGYPVVADATGRLADGYAVQDLPWIAVTSAAGKIRYQHDGWLPAGSLTRAAAGSG